MLENQKRIFRDIVLGTFPQNFIDRVYEREPEHNRIFYQAMEEVTEYTVPTPENPRTYFRHDGIISFFPQKEREDFRQFNISIEIKSSLEELLSDNKIDQYLGSTDYFFLAVPNELVGRTKEKIKHSPETAPWKGIIDATTGRIVIMPKQQKPFSRDRLIRLAASMFLTKRRVQDPEPAFQIHELILSK